MELERAIFIVLTTQFKKDMGGADKIVEEAGYLVRKGQGRYEVYNPKTQRCIYITGDTYKYVHYSWYRRDYAFRADEGCKFNFVGALNKPFNMEWYYLPRYDTRPTIKKYEELKWAKWRVQSRAKDIEKAMEALKKAEDHLIEMVRWEADAKADLIKVRKELGL